MAVKQLLTAEQLWDMPETPGKRFELVRGELVEVPGAGAQHGLIAGKFYRLLFSFVGTMDLGLVYGDGVGYIIGRDPDVVRIPDASFVSRGRIPESGVPKGYWPFAPDLAVEVVSPGDTATELRAKVREYLEGGARLVLVLWPDDRAVTAYPAGGDPRELGPDDELDGGEVLPGFRVRVADLFEIGA